MCNFQEVSPIVGELCANISPLFHADRMEATLYGSYARRDTDSGSDIDVLILVDAPRQTIMEKNWQIGDSVAELLLNHRVMVSLSRKTAAISRQTHRHFPFFRNISREGVRISA